MTAAPTTSGRLPMLACALLVGVFACVRCSVANAQASEGQLASPNDPAGYGQAIDRAVAAYEAGDYALAREHFAAAHALSPNARTLRGLGKAEFELRNYGQSLDYLEASLASQQKPLDERLREEVAALAERARAYVGELHVSVEPGTATVSIDGVKVASGPEASLSLVIGDHILEFHALGRVPEKRAVKIAAGERTSVQVALALPQPVSEAAAATVTLTPAAAPTRSETQASMWRKPWVWTAMAVVAAGATLGLVLALREPNQVEREAEPVATPNTPPNSTLQTLGAR